MTGYEVPPSLVCVDTGHPADPTEQPRLPYSQIPALPVPVSAAAFLLNFVEQQIPAAAASVPVSAAPVGCRWKPVYHVTVGDNITLPAWRKRRKLRRLELIDSPATSRPVDCVAAEITVTK
ncbi:hypothetical protein ABVT39_008647 [Epinephelus coioides]